MATFILSSLSHPLNIIIPIVVTLFGIVILFKLLHPPNAPASIVVTLFGRIMLSRLLQAEKEELPISVISSAILVVLHPRQQKNA